MIKTYRGWLSLHSSGEANDILFLSTVREPFAEAIQDDLGAHGHFVTVRYFVSDTDKTPDELTENLIRVVSGDLHADYGDHYSEYTGYLWTDEEVKVGGHDLLEELKGSVGKFAHIAMEYSKTSEGNTNE